VAACRGKCRALCCRVGRSQDLGNNFAIFTLKFFAVFTLKFKEEKPEPQKIAYCGRAFFARYFITGLCGKLKMLIGLPLLFRNRCASLLSTDLEKWLLPAF